MTRGSLAVLLGGCVFALACSDGGVGPSQPQVVEDPDAALQPVSGTHLPGFPARRSSVARPTSTVVVTREQWAAFWEQVHGSITPRPALPEVDFTREMVLFVAMGERGRGGHSIRITSLRSEPDHLVVNVLAISPASNCPATAEIQAPADAVRVSPRRRDVRFVQKDSVVTCR